MTYDDEIKEMLENKQWNEPVCMQLKINSEEFKQRISEFSTHLKCTMDGVGHDSIGDAHRHFISVDAQKVLRLKQHLKNRHSPTILIMVGSEDKMYN